MWGQDCHSLVPQKSLPGCRLLSNQITWPHHLESSNMQMLCADAPSTSTSSDGLALVACFKRDGI